MRKNNSYKEIWSELTEGAEVLLFPHVLVDGDALGSSIALCESLRQEGITAYIILEDSIPHNLVFLDNEYILNYKEYSKPENKKIICSLVDCGDYGRIPKREELYKSGSVKMVIDHHQSTKLIGEYNYVDSSAAATGEIIFDMLLENNVAISKEAAKAMFVAISTDTGNFQNANTNKKTHETVAELYKINDSYRDVVVELNENIPLKAMKLKGRLIDETKILCNEKVAVVMISQSLLEEMECKMDDADGISSLLRSIEGVEVAVVLKEKADSVKVSLRAKSYFNVAEIAEKFHGGGHIKAAGFSMQLPIDQVEDLLIRELEAAFNI